MFAALVAVFFFGDRLQGRRMVGLVLGFLGVVVLASGKTEGAGIAGAAIAGTIGSVCYGVGINLVRRYLSDLPPFAVACANLLSASIICAPLAIATWPDTPAPAAAWWSALALGALCSGLAFVMYYRLIARVGAPRAATVSYLIPLFGVFWAWMILGEAITQHMAIACAMILVGVSMSQQRSAPAKPEGAV